MTPAGQGWLARYRASLGRSYWWRAVWLTLYYLCLIIALLVMYGRSHQAPPPFIYQGF